MDDSDLDELAETPVEWERRDKEGRLFSSVIQGKEYLLRINDFPDEPLYTLLLGAMELAHFDDLPVAWRHS